MSINGALAPAAAVVAVDVGKTKAAVLVSDAQRHRLLGPLEFSMTAGGVAQVIIKSQAVLPAHVAEQRRVMGRRRVKTDALDLEAITELLLAGRGLVVTEPPTSIGELIAWAAHRHRRVATRTATKNQLLGQLDRCFPLPPADAAVARQVLAADLALLADLDTQIQAAETRMAELVPVGERQYERALTDARAAVRPARAQMTRRGTQWRL